MFPRNTIAISFQRQSVANLFYPGAKRRIITSWILERSSIIDVVFFMGLLWHRSWETNPTAFGIYGAEVVEFTSRCPEVASSPDLLEKCDLRSKSSPVEKEIHRRWTVGILTANPHGYQLRIENLQHLSPLSLGMRTCIGQPDTLLRRQGRF